MTDTETFCYMNDPVPEVRVYFHGPDYVTIEVRDADENERMTIPLSALAPIREGIKAALEVLNANG